jgi:hypothetical protein
VIKVSGAVEHSISQDLFLIQFNERCAIIPRSLFEMLAA